MPTPAKDGPGLPTPPKLPALLMLPMMPVFPPLMLPAVADSATGLSVIASGPDGMPAIVPAAPE